MFLNKSVILSLLLAFFLVGCSGSDDFGLGNGQPGTDVPGSTDETGAGEDSTTPDIVSPQIGSGSEDSFVNGVLTTGLAEGTELSFGGTTSISVSLVDSNNGNTLIPTPTLISFTSTCVDQGLATISETATTTAGVATVLYNATSCSGSDTVTATLTLSVSTEVTTKTASVTFDISSLDLGTGSGDSFTSGGISTSLGNADLSFGGDAVVSVNVVDSKDNSLFTATPVTVNFSSTCFENAKSTIDTSVISANGTAVATYSAIDCEGVDVITASLNDGTVASTSITVAGQVLGALEFVSAAPASLALKGSGSSSIPEVSTISFSLKDQTGAPMAGKTIQYALSTEVGGIALAQDSSVTNSQGLTSVKLNAGGVNASVVVTASVEIENSDGSFSTTSTTSKPISILGGIPDQDSFSIAVETFNPRAWDEFGTTSSITIFAADRFNNQARDGTQISFITNAGAIVGACELSGGSCSVNWNSQLPRPTTGLVRILARTTGEESFTDTNVNGLFDLNEQVTTNLSEAFLDINGNAIRDDDEFFSDFNNNGVYDVKSGTKFQGAGCSVAATDDGNCAKLVDVRATATLCMSGDLLNITNDAVGAVDLTLGQQTVVFNIADLRGLTPPQGTTVSVSAEDAEIVFGDQVEIPNECRDSGFSFAVTVKTPDNPTEPTGSLVVEVTQPDGIVIRSDVTLITL